MSTQAKSERKNKGFEKNIPIFKGLFFGVLSGIISLICMCAVMSFILTKTADPAKFISAACIISVIVSGAANGYITSKTCGKSMPYSIISASVIIFCFLAASAFISKETINNSMVFKISVIASEVISSFIFGNMCGKKSGNKKTRRQARKK